MYQHLRQSRRLSGVGQKTEISKPAFFINLFTLSEISLAVKDERPKVHINKTAAFQFGTLSIILLFNFGTAYAVDVNQSSSASS
ncbi:MAG: hypothetical protein EZS28_038364 [Streblomastix strix]|uniref:Uncharacterized protein n=1 Tax=Streblomastix strix TaxID=222440 RepID=A0A5J4U689_9EUKA|nr:MAG: hypothetical protein EZS28_038364 [Streblomastix strix]